ncbi:hypothetical protein CCHR01_10279 [Colletotrichum chrysophilum]|uniref:Uncharacterized protein n=1 Tax=Colletotrichum chrysophilum TaxID=1836956 RepID=A0AAD9EGY6_9PEZI|nr:hypothetical protein CCHR01_10279 [Colletotrichum chrysophilum]
MANAQIPIQQIEYPSWSAATTTAAAVITITNQNQYQHQHHQTVDTTRDIEVFAFVLLLYRRALSWVMDYRGYPDQTDPEQPEPTTATA